MLAEVKAGRVSVKEAAEHCYEMRNKIMAITRTHTSKQGLAVAEANKRTAKSQIELLNRNSEMLFNKNYLELDEWQKQKVYYALIESSARPRASVNVANKVLRVTGKVLIVVTAVYAVYEIANAENKRKEAVRQGAMISGGIAATALAGLTVSTVCGPAFPACTIGFLLAAGGIGGWATSELLDTFDEEIEEFSKWQMR